MIVIRNFYVVLFCRNESSVLTFRLHEPLRLAYLQLSRLRLVSRLSGQQVARGLFARQPSHPPPQRFVPVGRGQCNVFRITRTKDFRCRYVLAARYSRWADRFVRVEFFRYLTLRERFVLLFQFLMF